MMDDLSAPGVTLALVLDCGLHLRSQPRTRTHMGAMQTATIEAPAGRMEAQNTGLPDVERLHAVLMAG